MSVLVARQINRNSAKFVTMILGINPKQAQHETCKRYNILLYKRNIQTAIFKNHMTTFGLILYELIKTSSKSISIVNYTRTHRK